MNTKMRKFFIGSALLLATVGLVTMGFITGVFAAPGEAPSGSIQAAPMTALTEVPCTLVGTTRTCELWARTGSLTMPDGVIVPVWGFADSALGLAQVPGPIIRGNAGETLEIVLHNELVGESVAIAFPGQEFIPDLVGAPSTGSATFSVYLADAGTYLYEAGLTPGGSRQVVMGLFGPLIVGPAPLADQEVVMVFSGLDPAFNADPLNFSLYHFQPKYWLINGQAYPDTGTIDVAADTTVLMRYLNAGVEQLTLGLLGVSQQVLASDGETLVAPHSAIAEPLAPGETKEALVAVPLVNSGTLFPLYNTSLHQHNNNQRLSDMRAAFGGMLTFLRVTGGTDPGASGPVPSNVLLSHTRTDGSVDVIFSATLTDTDNVAAYEVLVDVVPPPGTGTPVVPPAGVVNVAVTFTPADMAAWTSGEHTLYIRGQDALGTWGSLGSASFYLDKAGPSIAGLSLYPNPTNGLVDVTLNATADDRATGNGSIVAAEYSLDGGTTWAAMTLSDLGTSVRAMTATLLAADIQALGEGAKPVMVRAQDDLLNWTNPPAAITLNVALTGPEVPTTLLSPVVLDFTQTTVPLSVRLTGTIQDPLINGVQSKLVNAEGFIRVVGTPGTGFTVYPSDGLFDEPVENIYYNIPSSYFSSFISGDYPIYLLGKDQAGNWSPIPGTVTITIINNVVDTAGPVVSNLSVVPNPAARNTTVTLTALATDVNLMSNIVSAEYWIGTRANATRVVMTAVDGAFDSPSEWIRGLVVIPRNMRPGTYTIFVRAMDAAGNWGPVQSINLIVE